MQSNLATQVAFDTTVRISCCIFIFAWIIQVRRYYFTRKEAIILAILLFIFQNTCLQCAKGLEARATALFTFMSSEGSLAVGGSARCLMTRIWLIIQKEPCVGLNRNVLLCQCLRWLAAERRHGSLSNPTWQRSPRMIGSGRKLSKCS